MPKAARRSLSWERISEIWEDLAAALDSGRFDERTDRHLGSTDLTLDESGWAELGEELRGLQERALAIQERSAQRVAGRRRRGASPRGWC